MVQADLLSHLLNEARRDGVTRLVVGAVIPRQGLVLLLKRAPHDFMQGILELPSGAAHEGESLSDALRREVAEETGLEVREIGEYLGSFDYLSRSGHLSRQFNFVTATVGESITLTEHSGYIWASDGDLAQPLITDSTRNVIKNYLERHHRASEQASHDRR